MDNEDDCQKCQPGYHLTSWRLGDPSAVCVLDSLPLYPPVDRIRLETGARLESMG